MIQQPSSDTVDLTRDEKLRLNGILRTTWFDSVTSFLLAFALLLGTLVLLLVVVWMFSDARAKDPKYQRITTLNKLNRSSLADAQRHESLHLIVLSINVSDHTTVMRGELVKLCLAEGHGRLMPVLFLCPQGINCLIGVSIKR